MKKYLIRTALVLAAITACNKEIEAPAPVVDNGQEEATPGKVTLTFTAAISEETRTAYTNDKTASWVAGDAISVCLKKGTNYEVVKFTTSDGSVFSAQVSQGYSIVSGVYPANSNHVFTAGAVTSVYLPDTYNLKTANDGGIALPMVGEMVNGTFTFHHICGALKIEVVDIFDALTFTTAGEKIAGLFPLNDQGRISISTAPNTATNNVTFSYGRLQSYIDNGEYGPRGSRTFYIPIPDGTLAGGATMALKSGSSVVYEKQTSATNSISFNSNIIKRFPEIGMNFRSDWSISVDMNGAAPEIEFDPHDANQLYIRLTTTRTNFEGTYHGSVEAFLEARIQSNSNGTQTGLQTYIPSGTYETYLQDPNKVFIMCGVNKVGSSGRKCNFDYYLFSTTVSDPATESYKAWLGQWTVNDGSKTDTWTISRKQANQTYSISGIAGRTSNSVEGNFSSTNNTLTISSQSDVGAISNNQASLLKRNNSSGKILSVNGNVYGLVITELLLNNGEVTLGNTNNGYGFYWMAEGSSSWSSSDTYKRNKISTMTRRTE